ncbi:MAG: hypothetical protein DLM52_07345 [Chthoniobacterales bacterium]|nr:MAG: hypothetical protein DLM52_07345 [Chthoniobacterales bacterium]
MRSRLAFIVVAFLLAQAAVAQTVAVRLVQPNVIISVKDQKLMLLENGSKRVTYPVSTSRFGMGDDWGSMTTPIGLLQVAQKIGDHAPVGAVFHRRRFTGEILTPNAPGRDPVITRIIWLRGLQPGNAHAYNRCIYIHGTPEEKTIGRPASYGCIRMKSADVTTVYSQLPLGAIVQITPDRLPKAKRLSKEPAPTAVASAQAKPAILTTNKAAAEPAPKAQTAPLKKSDATAWLRNARA